MIAGGEEKWREVKEKSGKCRIGYVLKDKSGMLEIERMTCYTKELTAGVTAETAVRDLQALDVPPSMEGLVDETVAALQMLVDADLENACGPAMSEPKDSEACSSALGTRSMGYQLLTSALDKWKPYF